MSGLPHGIHQPAPREQVRAELVRRARARLQAASSERLIAWIEDCVWNERQRFERAQVAPDVVARIDHLAASLLAKSDAARVDAILALVDVWADEIHGRFSPRAYRAATRVLPSALTALLSARPKHLRDWDLSVERRLRITGEVDVLKELVGEATVVLAPTHVSNLDSPLIGLALYLAGLPPFVYGAGLNLFSNPVMGWWLRRLGAFTVDRTKKSALYKDVLKDYQVWLLTTRHHSLFFPGGTRSRSGLLEGRPKKGLLGAGISAWQEMIVAGRPDADVYVVPLTLSFQLVLEAETLISDHLEEAGKQRFIIVDDEFARPQRVASFARRVLDLDASVVAHFGAPLDCLGNPVSADRAERAEQSVRRRDYVLGADGAVEADPQRDRVYTDRLADALVTAWPKGSVAMSTHLAAWAAWRCMQDGARTADPFRIVRLPVEARRVPKAQLLNRINRALAELRAGAAAGRWPYGFDTDAAGVLARAFDLFGRYHKGRALADHGDVAIVEDAKLCFYYHNRLAHLALEA